MEVFAAMARDGHEQLCFCREPVSGLRAVIAIHNSTLGPALGGCRMWKYAREEEVIRDALRLSRGMTEKNTAAGLNYGGGKCVIWGDPARDKSEALFRALGRFVEGFRGRFITGTDVGTVSSDFVWASTETLYVVALPEEYGGSGDTSVTTAFAVWKGMKACARVAFGDDSLRGRTVALQGVGKVGAHLAQHLHEEGASLVACDANPDRLEEVAARIPLRKVDPEEIFDVECDIFSPNALGGVLNDVTVPRLRCRVVAGAANNQLEELRHGDMLKERGILYAPDFIINAGGVIQAADELEGYNRDRALRKVAGIYDQLLEVFRIAAEQDISPARAAYVYVERRLRSLGALGRILVPRGASE
ncbi:MAG: Glu/Leu/Phe/Val dehydrogenase [Bacillota bacterium]|nr:Glu/Leu/Phe/Val dehydrogenase [Bacillota bacterium]MDI7248472.1 Glu/Leu/Phe/Val dehydrogenase [Bacillota bacterium]